MGTLSKRDIENCSFLYEIGSNKPIALINNDFLPSLLKELRENHPFSKGAAKRSNLIGHKINFVDGWSEPIPTHINDDIIKQSEFKAFVPIQRDEKMLGSYLNYKDMPFLNMVIASIFCK
jgi:hypothetical protein